MFIRVVLKQYSGTSFKSIFKEIKIFTHLENHKKVGNQNTFKTVIQQSK